MIQEQFQKNEQVTFAFATSELFLVIHSRTHTSHNERGIRIMMVVFMSGGLVPIK